MPWSWVRLKTSTSPKLRDCMGDDKSAGKFEDCVRGIVADRGGRVDDPPRGVMFHPSGRWARVLFEWQTHEEKLGIVLDLEPEEVHDLASAGDIDALRG